MELKVLGREAEKKSQAKDREIVIAEVDGENTMKYFREKGQKKWELLSGLVLPQNQI